MIRKIYIIGNLSEVIDKSTEIEFFNTEIRLLNMGYFVINPAARLLNNKTNQEIVKKRNILELIASDAVYIMPSVNSTKMSHNIELKLAIKFNKLIITGLFNVI